MTIHNAIQALIISELECLSLDCRTCPVNESLGIEDGLNCAENLEKAAITLRTWLESLPEGRLSDVTVEDLL